MRCPKCNSELTFSFVKEPRGPYQPRLNKCEKCNKIYSDEELQDILDAEMIEDDMEAWRSAQKFK